MNNRKKRKTRRKKNERTQEEKTMKEGENYRKNERRDFSSIDQDQ